MSVVPHPALGISAGAPRTPLRIRGRITGPGERVYSSLRLAPTSRVPTTLGVLEVGFVILGRTAAGIAVDARRALGRHSGVRSSSGQAGCDGGSAAMAARMRHLVDVLGDGPVRQPGAESLE